MDPNPLQYQTKDDNQPLYQAAGLTAAAMIVLIAIGFAISYALKRPDPTKTASQAQLATSPDDPVAGGSQGFAQNSFSSGSSSNSGMERPNNVVNSGGGPSYSPPAPVAYTPPSSMPGGGFVSENDAAGNYAVGIKGSGQPAGGNRQVQAAQVQDWASLSPDSMAALLGGR